MSTAQDPKIKVSQIQTTLRDNNVDGWLLYNFRQSNVFASKVLDLPSHLTQMRRYFYYIPAQGVPQKIVHGIEAHNLDHLPGEKTVYVSWQSLHAALRGALRGAKCVAMEYSPDNSIPYVSKVDAGTVELIRSFGVDVVSSGDIVQYFEARWSDEQRMDQFETCDILRKTVDVAFGFIGDRLRAGTRVTEYDVQQRMARYFVENGLAYGDAPNCSVNSNGANPHYEPTEDIYSEVHKGDYVLIDLWAKKDKPGSVYGDITWVAYAGDVIPAKYQQVFEIVKGARDAAVDYVRTEFASGRKVRGCDVDDVTRTFIADSGFGEYFIHRTGHNIGEEVHGNGAHIDNLETNDRREIIPETCFSIEPGIYLPGEFGVRLEIDVYIDADRRIHIPGQPIQQEIVRIQC
ncbi:MAG: M24 family metallopeptidase [Ignavibacteriales bacterium]|nr:M24 family metallopeptidase [Ignavibacteriales bacterium]